jgi:hypothetical protein
MLFSYASWKLLRKKFRNTVEKTFQFILSPILYNNFNLKGQSHKKVCEIVIWNVSFGLN